MFLEILTVCEKISDTFSNSILPSFGLVVLGFTFWSQRTISLLMIKICQMIFGNMFGVWQLSSGLNIFRHENSSELIDLMGGGGGWCTMGYTS